MPTRSPLPFGSPLWVLLLAAMVSVGAAWGAHAQQQVPQGGYLDANLQVGSGGANPYAIQPDFRARNLLITGNVTDGRQFRGDVGYGAPGAFGGTLGTDDLFRFRADSYRSGAAGVNLAPSLPDYGLAGSSVIYNNFFSVTPDVVPTATVRNIVNADGTRSSYVDPGQRFNPEFTGVERLTNTSVGDGRFDDRIGFNGTSVGLVVDEQGRSLQVDASPVFGVRRTQIQNDNPAARNAVVAAQPDDSAQETSAFNTQRVSEPIRAPLGPDRPLADPALPEGQELLDPTAPRGAALNTRRAFDADDRPAVASLNAVDPEVRRDPLTGLPLSLQVGSRLTPGLITGRTTGDAAVEEQRVEQLSDAIFRPLDTAAATPEGENAYLDLLRKIREEEQAGEGGQAQPGPGGLARPAWMRNLDAPDDDLVKEAEDRRLNAIARILRAAQEQEADPNRPVDPAKQRDREITTAAMESLLKQLSYDLPRLETLQGDRQNRINAAFGAGERALADEQYFNAEAIYSQLVRDAPDNPLGLVGRMHAQMAAGMVRSAALSLRSLFEKHPELIATRYAEQLLPPQNRLEFLRGELQKMIEDESLPNSDAGLMLAYLGYQVESRQLIRYGLAVAQEAAPLDPLMPLLRGIWLGKDQIEK